MSMEMHAWTSLYQRDARTGRDAGRSPRPRCGASPPSPARTAAARWLFLLLSVVAAVLAVATPVLAGRVVDAIVDGGRDRHVSSARRCSSP